ncbi:IclR family transcriptional regulator [Roseibium aggregatum]|uniref:IclR family transcriptional regulator n=1 Tax=Roseibium aggregatum TaxID=187304 RepID=A0A926NZR3_9HYPH|nr:IclR family transcriptional regulator [Roseibium aggregatum]MBD1548444.1 IclR family transcriptional regulator [Roseibium aggregatum]
MTDQGAIGGTASLSAKVAEGARFATGGPRTGKSIQAVDRALTMLEILAGSKEALGLNELAARAGLNASTCHHLVQTLVGRGYVLQVGRNRGYMLSSRLNELVELQAGEADLADIVKPEIEALAEQLGEAVQLATLHGTKLVTQLRVGRSSAVVEVDEIRKMTALHATATGKAILAWLPDAEIMRVISENGLDRYTSKTITMLHGLIEELRHVRRHGFAIDDEELRDGVVCVGAAIRDEKGAVIASISATYAAHKNSDAYRTHVITGVTETARRLSDQLKANRY